MEQQEEELLGNLVKMVKNRGSVGKKRASLEKSLAQLNKFLKNDPTRDMLEDEAQKRLFEGYKESAVGVAISDKILTSLDGTESSTNTSGYCDIYFNEIVQNANDQQSKPWKQHLVPQGKRGQATGQEGSPEVVQELEQGNPIEISVSKNDEGYYCYHFSYQDEGFAFENIVGFLNLGLHGKTLDASTTGRHGVGIKSLLHFVNHLRVESNVIIDVEISNHVETGLDSKITLDLNEAWDKECTHLFMTFPGSEVLSERACSDDSFQTKKLEDFSDALLRKDYRSCSSYIIEDDMKHLVFDWRNLLFTDKNLGKKLGIQTLSWNEGEFVVSAHKEKSVYSNQCFDVMTENLAQAVIPFCVERVCLSITCGREGTVEKETLHEKQYLTFSVPQAKEQITIAFPLEEENSSQQWQHERYYHTYYIPVVSGFQYPLPICINGGSSNMTRTKLSDDDIQLAHIHQNYDGYILLIYQMMCDKSINNSPLREEISVLFHKIVYLCYSGNISAQSNIHMSKVPKGEKGSGLNTRHLQKWRNNLNHGDNQEETQEQEVAVVFQQKQQELFEMRLPNPQKTVEELREFFQETVKGQDAIPYNDTSREGFLPIVAACYDLAFYTRLKSLCEILNAFHSVKDLYYYRICNSTPPENSNIVGGDLDRWHKGRKEDFSSQEAWYHWIDCSLIFVGIYGLHSGVDYSGQPMVADVFDYLFTRRTQEEEPQGSENCGEGKEKNRFFSELAQIEYGNVEMNRLRDVLWGQRKMIPLYTNENANTKFYWRYYENQDTNTLLQQLKSSKDDLCPHPTATRSIPNTLEKRDLLLLCRLFVIEPKLWNRMFAWKGGTLCLLFAYVSGVAKGNGENADRVWENEWEENTSHMEQYLWLWNHSDWLAYGEPSNTWSLPGYFAVYKMVECDFFHRLVAESLEEFSLYLSFLFGVDQRWSSVMRKCSIDTVPLTINSKEMSRLFSLAYSKEMKKLYEYSYVTCDEGTPLKLSMGYEITQNQCGKELFDFIKFRLGIEVYLKAQGKVGTEGRENQILYTGQIAGNNYPLSGLYATSSSPNRVLGKMLEYPQVASTHSNKLFIWYSDANGIDEQKAITTVFKAQFTNGDAYGNVMDLIKSFIPPVTQKENIKEVSLEVYERYASQVTLQKEARGRGMTALATGDFSKKRWEQMLATVGAQGERCGCCGAVRENSSLVVLLNQNEESWGDYPYVYLLLCEQCHTIVRSGLQKCKLCVPDGQGGEGENPTVVLECLVQCGQQEEKVTLVSEISTSHCSLLKVSSAT